MSQSSSPCPQSWHEAETAAAIPILSCLKTASPPSPTPTFLTDNFPVRKLVTPDYSALFQLTAGCQSGTHDPGKGVLKVNIPHTGRVDHFNAGFE